MAIVNTGGTSSGGSGTGSPAQEVTVLLGETLSAGFERPTPTSWISSLQFVGASNVSQVRILASASEGNGSTPPVYAGINAIPYLDGTTQSLVDYIGSIDDTRFWGNVSGFGYFVLQTEDGAGTPTAPLADIEIIVGFTG